MIDEQWFELTFVAPTGRTYDITVQAASEVEAVQAADDTLDEVEPVKIREFLVDDDHVAVRSPARLRVEQVKTQALTGLNLVITDTDGAVTRR